MKTRLFLFGVMMAACLTGQEAKAQDLQMATLQHGEDMNAYYGPNALNDALGAAATGDVISLSSGVFDAPAITKAVAIQGAGYVMDAPNNRYRTTFRGTTNINIPNGEAGLLLEGLHFVDDVTVDGDSICQFIIRKCRMGNLTFNAKIVDGEIYHNKIYNLDWTETRNLFIHHDVIRHLQGNDNSNEVGVVIDHCVITWGIASDVTAVIQNSLIRIAIGTAGCAYYNNVCADWSVYTSIQSGNTALGNWYNLKDLFANIPTENLFRNDDVNWYDTYDYRLTDAAAATYVCSDGTQVGLYGGTVPFTDVPTTPQIVEKNIATQTDGNGMLSVKIKVDVQK